MAPIERLTDSRIRSLVKQPRTEEESVADGAVPGLYLRLYPGGSASWTLFYRVVGEGGTNRHGKPLVGKKHRLGLGFYPKVSLQAVRAKANNLIELAMQGINPKDAFKEGATATWPHRASALGRVHEGARPLARTRLRAPVRERLQGAHQPANRRTSHGPGHAGRGAGRNELGARETLAPEGPAWSLNRWHRSGPHGHGRSAPHVLLGDRGTKDQAH